MSLNKAVQNYWNKEPCGTNKHIVGELKKNTPEWFHRFEQHRYTVEPIIHSIAQFTRYHGKKILEVGVGAGTDHLQWARAGAECYGVDLTDAAIEITKAHLALYDFESNLQQVDAEKIPYEDNSFDVVYSWGVIHHSEQPSQIINEIHRVLKPRGEFIGMMYNRRSLVSLIFWVKYGLLKGKPWRSYSDILWHHMESLGTKAYTPSELKQLFNSFNQISIERHITVYDKDKSPRWLSKYYPNHWGWFSSIKAIK